MNNPSPFAITSELDPIIVTAPTIRSGTTLLQRLLCSSSNTLIYGEECGKDLELFLGLYESKAMLYAYSRQRASTTLKKVLDGDVNDWILALMPDVDGYVEAVGHGCLSGLAYCRDYAAEVGRPLWGIKYPGWPPQFLRLLRRIMPQSRFIIIYRDVADCLRSAKARRSINSEQEARQFCKLWADNLTFMLGLKNDPSSLLLNYADLVNEPAETIETLTRFAGIEGMRLDTLSHKINTRVEDESLRTNQPGYIKPAELTETEMIIAQEAASALRGAMPEEQGGKKAG